MRIVIDGRIIHSSTGRYVERLVTYLQEMDAVNEYIVLLPTKDLDFWKPSRDNFSVVACDYSNYSIGEQVGMLKQLNSLKPDLVHFCMPQQPVLYRGKTITTIHDLTLLRTGPSAKNPFMFRLKQFIGRYVFHEVIRKSNALLTDSEFSKQDIEQFDPRARGKTTVTYLGAGASSSDLSPYELPFAQYLLFVGQQLDHKNIPRLAEAHQQLLEQYPDLGLVLAGRLTPEAQANQAHFESLGYKNIHFTDYISDAELNWLYTHCAVYVFPSLMEGFGLPGLEAMGQGAPVASSNTTSLPEILGNAALYFDPTDTKAMADTIGLYLGDESLRTQHIALGREHIKKFSWQQMAEETLAVYKNAVEE